MTMRHSEAKTSKRKHCKREYYETCPSMAAEPTVAKIVSSFVFVLQTRGMACGQRSCGQQIGLIKDWIVAA